MKSLDKFIVRAFKFLDPPLKALAYLVGGPLHLLGMYLCRQRCPTCGKRSLEGFTGRKEGRRGRCALGVCLKCKSTFEFLNESWRRTGTIE